MEKNSFLESLKSAVDKGEFNSEAAKKIIEIEKLAKQTTKESREKFVKERENAIPVENISEEEAIRLNEEYKKKMEEIKEREALNIHIVNLIDMEDLIKLSIADMMEHVAELEIKFEKDFNSNSTYMDLQFKIKELKTKYSSLLVV